MVMLYAGYQINFVQDQITQVPRTWKERLFSMPWRPWVATRTNITPAIIKPGSAYILGNTAYVHEADRKSFINSLAYGEKERASSSCQEAPRPTSPSPTPANASGEAKSTMLVEQMVQTIKSEVERSRHFQSFSSFPSQSSATPFKSPTGRISKAEFERLMGVDEDEITFTKTYHFPRRMKGPRKD